MNTAQLISTIEEIFAQASYSTHKKEIGRIMAGERGNGELHSKKPKLGKDRISELPDCILLHIMSFLTTKQVIQTCLLSKRWEFLWTQISEIDLVEKSDNYAKIRRFVDMVGRMLLMCSGMHLNKFAVDFWGEDFKSNVNLWVQFIVKNKVKYITLRLSCRSPHEFTIPRMLYSHSSMLSLTVNSCIMEPREGAIKWGSLKTLAIEGVTFPDNVSDKILSGSPVLEFLHISHSWGFSCSNISTPTLATLIIEDSFVGDEDYELFEISAPYVLDLSIVSTQSYKFRLGNVSSVVRAKIDLRSEDLLINHDLSNAMDYMKQSLQSLKSVKELELGPCYMKVLSLLEIEGWQFPTSVLKSLTLHVWMDNESIPGILCILKSSPKLETLVIKWEISPSYEDNVHVGQAEAYLQNSNLELVLSNLKTINITTYTDDISSFITKPSTDSLGPVLTLLQILFKGATVLEKVVISAKHLDITKLLMALINIPRVSSTSVVLFD